MADAPINSAYAMQMRQSERQLLKFAIECSEDIEEAAARLGVTTIFMRDRINWLGGVLPHTKPNEPLNDELFSDGEEEENEDEDDEEEEDEGDDEGEYEDDGDEDSEDEDIEDDEDEDDYEGDEEEDEAEEDVAQPEEPEDPKPPLFKKAPTKPFSKEALDSSEDLVKQHLDEDAQADADLARLKARAQTIVKSMLEEREVADIFEPGDEEEVDDEEEEAEAEEENDEEFDEERDIEQSPFWEPDAQDVPRDSPPKHNQPIAAKAPPAPPKRPVGRPPVVNPDPSKYCTYRDVVAITGLSVSSVHLLRNQGRLTPIRQNGIVLFDSQEVAKIAKSVQQKKRS